MDKQQKNILEEARKKIVKEQMETGQQAKVLVSKEGKLYIKQKNSNEKIFLGNSEIKKVLPNDIVSVVINSIKGKKYAIITKIIESNTNKIIGVVYKNKKGFCLKPFDAIYAPIFINKSFKKLSENEVVEVEIKSHPFELGYLFSELSFSIGYSKENDIKIKIAKFKNQIVTPDFNKYLLEDVINKVENNFSTSSDREDLRDLNFFSIDSENTKDIDDALYFEKKDNIFNVYIAISDVSSLVKENSEIEKNAIIQTSSVYFPSNVNHMIPESVSEQYLSLNSGLDRNVFVLCVKVNMNGEILSYEYKEGIINSKAKLSYSEVNYYLNNRFVSKKISKSNISEQLDKMVEVYDILRAKREKVNIVPNYFESYFYKIENGFIDDIVPFNKNIVKSIIEEFMVLANHLTGEFFTNYENGIFKNKKKYLLENPYFKFIKSNKLETEFNVQTHVNNYKKLSNIYSEKFVNRLNENSICSSKLELKNSGHYSLGLNSYSSFTSPLRKVSDIFVHRAIKYYSGIKGYSNPFTYCDEEMLSYINEKERNIEKARQEALNMFFYDFIKKRNLFKNMMIATIIKIEKEKVFININDFGIKARLILDKKSIDFSNQKIIINNNAFTLNQNIQIVIKYINKNQYGFFAKPI